MIKKAFKEALPAFVLAFTTSFMLFIFEPIATYANNVNDFTFNLSELMPIMLRGFAYCFVCIIEIFLIYYVASFLIKKLLVRFGHKTTIQYHYIFLAIGFVLFFSAYIEGNFLAGNLPSLGSAPSIIHWGDTVYVWPKIISWVIWAMPAVASFVFAYKFGLNRVIICDTYIALAVFVMLLSGLVFTCVNTDAFSPKENNVISTTKNLNLTSKEKNFYIFLLDTVSAVEFDNYLSNSEDNLETFKDFVFYKDTMGGYPATLYSIPFILSGMWTENETSFANYSTAALDNAPLLSKLNEEEYIINLYEDEITWQSDRNSMVDNFEPYEPKLDTKTASLAWLKWLRFKYLPFSLKADSGIEYFELNPSYSENNSNIFDGDNKRIYDYFNSNDLALTDNKVFQFIHVEGAHIPYNYDENLNETTDGTYEKKLGSSITLFKTWVQKLKKAGVYDNSIIILMSDHGYNKVNYEISNDYNHINRQNPILLIKGINEKHTQMKRSDLPISFTDLNQAYFDLLSNKKAAELFADIPKERKRRYLYYDFTDDAHMIEYEQTGKAWDDTTMVPTGRVYSL